MPPRRAPRSRTTPITEEEVQQRIAEALANHEASRNNGGGGGEGSGATNTENPPSRCSFKDFLSCKPIIFKGPEGAIGLMRWIEKMESVFLMSKCPDTDKVKYATGTLQDSALTWWNTNAQALGLDAAYSMSWSDLKRMLTEQYCPRNEIKKLETEFWNHATIGLDIDTYTQRFQELALLCPNFVTPEYKRIEQYIQGLPSQIKGDVTSSNITEIQPLILLAHKLVDQIKLQLKSDSKLIDNKRKWVDFSDQNQVQQPTIKAYVTGYAGNYPYCNKCNRHHSQGPCNNMVCGKCKNHGHFAKDCQNLVPVAARNAPGNCYNCGERGHFRNQCPMLRTINTQR